MSQKREKEYLEGIERVKKGKTMISLSCVNSILLNLDILLEYSNIIYDKKAFELIFKELSPLKFYLTCLAEWNFGIVDESYILQATLEEADRILKIPLIMHSATLLAEFDAVVPELREKIRQCKPKIEEDCLNFLEFPFQRKFSSDKLPKFIDLILRYLRYHLKADMTLDMEAKIEDLKDNLDFSKEVFDFATRRCTSQEDWNDFKIHIQAWACKAACLSLLYWVLEVNKENVAQRMDVILFDLQKEISPATPEVTRMYLAVLKASKASANDGVTVGKLVMKFVKFLKDNLQVDPEKDEVQMLFTDLIFLTTFLMEGPEDEKFASKKILTQADNAVNEVESLISSLCSGDIEEGIAEERNFFLHNFLEKATAIKAEGVLEELKRINDEVIQMLPLVRIKRSMNIFIENKRKSEPLSV